MRRAFGRAVRLAAGIGFVAASAMFAKGGSAAEAVAITIATGQVGGLYHPVGGAICRLVNGGQGEHGISCTVEITEGSVDNIRKLRLGIADFAIAQSDVQDHAYAGTTPFEDAGPFPTLRSVFAIYVEQFIIVARRDRFIRRFEDLKGHRIFLGEAGSGERRTMAEVMTAHGWTDDDVIDTAKIESRNEAVALCDGEIDAFVLSIGNPNSLLRRVTAMCDAVLVPVDEAVIDRLAKVTPYHIRAVIPGGLYLGNPHDIPTLGKVATLLTTAEMAPSVVYQVARAFFDSFDTLRELSPIFSTLSVEEMTRVGLGAPLHEGAVRYFTEVGLM